MDGERERRAEVCVWMERWLARPSGWIPLNQEVDETANACCNKGRRRSAIWKLATAARILHPCLLPLLFLSRGHRLVFRRPSQLRQYDGAIDEARTRQGQANELQRNLTPSLTSVPAARKLWGTFVVSNASRGP